MKKRLFRERYNMVNGEGEIVKENLTIEEVKEITKDAAEIETPNVAEVKVELKKRGRRKSVKSNK